VEIKPTEEQQSIISDYRNRDSIKINAFAGTGKTATLKMLGGDNPRDRFLFLAFNKAIATEAQRTFPQNVMASTVHSLAYRALKRFGLIKGIVNKKEFTDILIELLQTEDLEHVLFIRDLFELYCYSFVADINHSAIETLISQDRAMAIRHSYLKLSIQTLVGEIQHIYNSLQDSKVMPHSFYLKLFANNLESFAPLFRNYDAILIDEAQDLNPVQIKIFRELPIKKKVMVGDTHQSIYGWRKAVNAMNMPIFRNFDTYYLTESFRFQNNDIATYANNILHNFKNEDKRIKVFKNNKRSTGRTAVISRTNARLVLEMLQEITNKRNTEIALTRNINDLFQSLKIASEVLNYFQYQSKMYLTPGYMQKTVKDCEFLGRVNDVETMIAIDTAKIIRKKYRSVGKAYKIVAKAIQGKAKNVYTTAHSAKGLEFDEVELLSDFPGLDSLVSLSISSRKQETENAVKRAGIENTADRIANTMINSSISTVTDEINLQYVAITRGVKRVTGIEYTVEGKTRENLKSAVLNNLKKQLVVA